MQRFPWGEIMRHGIVGLQIPPWQFWNCTLRELVPLRGAAVMARGVLNELMEAWPDE